MHRLQESSNSSRQQQIHLSYLAVHASGGWVAFTLAFSSLARMALDWWIWEAMIAVAFSRLFAFWTLASPTGRSFALAFAFVKSFAATRTNQASRYFSVAPTFLADTNTTASTSIVGAFSWRAPFASSFWSRGARFDRAATRTFIRFIAHVLKPAFGFGASSGSVASFALSSFAASFTRTAFRTFSGRLSVNYRSISTVFASRYRLPRRHSFAQSSKVRFHVAKSKGREPKDRGKDEKQIEFHGGICRGAKVRKLKKKYATKRRIMILKNQAFITARLSQLIIQSSISCLSHAQRSEIRYAGYKVRGHWMFSLISEWSWETQRITLEPDQES